MFRVSTLVASATNRLNSPSSTDRGPAESAGAATVPSMRALCCGFSRGCAGDVVVIQGTRKVAAHGFGELEAHGSGLRLHGRLGRQGVVDVPATILRRDGARPFRHGRNGEQRTYAQGNGDYRPITNVEALIGFGPRRAGIDLALMVYHA